MPLDRATARDELATLVKDALVAEDDLQLAWDDVPFSVPDTTVSWARTTIRHEVQKQWTLGPSGQRRFRSWGTLFVEVFTPSGMGLTESDRLAKIVVDAMRAATTPGGVVLRDAKAREIGPDGGWQKINCTAAFEYDEVG